MKKIIIQKNEQSNERTIDYFRPSEADIVIANAMADACDRSENINELNDDDYGAFNLDDMEW